MGGAANAVVAAADATAPSTLEPDAADVHGEAEAPAESTDSVDLAGTADPTDSVDPTGSVDPAGSVEPTGNADPNERP